MESIKQMSGNPEPFIPVNGSAGNSAPVGGRRRRRTGKLKLVTRKQARKVLKKLHLKMRGGAPTDPVAVPEAVADAAKKPVGGKRKTRRSASRKASMGRFLGL
jgi:hypothetical protein